MGFDHARNAAKLTLGITALERMDQIARTSMLRELTADEVALYEQCASITRAFKSVTGRFQLVENAI